MKALDKLRELSMALIPQGIEATEKEAELLITHGLDMSTVGLYRDNPEISVEQEKRIDELCTRRMAREPLQYVLGYVEFLGLHLKVERGVLIPRPETELMAEHAIHTVRSEKSAFRSERTQAAKGGKGITILDLCTGSGCLALALARAFPEAAVLGIDISGVSVKVARDNALSKGIRNVAFLKGDLFDPLKTKYDFIFSNPPYIKTDDIGRLQPEIRDWEPVSALDGGKDGLHFFRRIIPASPDFLYNNGTVMLECGDSQSNEVAGLFKETGFEDIRTIKDMAGVERIIQARWIR